LSILEHQVSKLNCQVFNQARLFAARSAGRALWQSKMAARFDENFYESAGVGPMRILAELLVSEPWTDYGLMTQLSSDSISFFIERAE
jgi:hypothetical protein